MIRPVCGTMRGALAHQAAGEPWCGWCRDAERAAAMEAERFASPAERLTGPSLPGGGYAPVTWEQAARNAALLDAEVLAYEKRGARDRHLRALPAVDGAA